MGQGRGTGVAYVFQHRGSTWTEQAELRAPDRRPGDWFGNAVALDGDTAVVGASLEGNKGAAYIFVRHGNAWIEQAKLTAHDLAPADWFDRAVAVSGNTALVGAWYHHGAAGAVYVFTREGSTWTEQAELTAADRQADAYFGTSVALGGDTAVVGAAGAQDDSGAAYVFVRGHGRWTQQAELRAPGNPCCATFGTSVALSGATVLVGAGFARGNKGAAYVFTKVGEQWSPRATLLANDGQAGDWFGWTVALSGGTALVGAWYRQGSRGAAYLFVRQGRGWRERAELLAADGKQGDGFGSSVALSGSIGLAGAGFKDHARGGVYVFSTAGTTTVL